VENNEETTRTWREVLYGTKGLEQYVAAAILHSEKFEQQVGKQVSLPYLLT